MPNLILHLGANQCSDAGARARAALFLAHVATNYPPGCVSLSEYSCMFCFPTLSNVPIRASIAMKALALLEHMLITHDSIRLDGYDFFTTLAIGAKVSYFKATSVEARIRALNRNFFN